MFKEGWIEDLVSHIELPSLEDLKDMGYFAEGLVYYCHYHPTCPQPALTMGTSEHADNAYLTVLMLVASKFFIKNQWMDWRAKSWGFSS